MEALLKDLDYVENYAKAIRNNLGYFKQQKMLIESQLNSSKELFKKRFGAGKKFEINARKHLKNIGKL